MISFFLRKIKIDGDIVCCAILCYNIVVNEGSNKNESDKKEHKMIKFKKVSNEIFEYHKFVEFKNIPDAYFEKAYAKVGLTKEVIKRRFTLESLEGLTFPIYEEEEGIEDFESNLVLPTVDILSNKILSVRDYYKTSIHYQEAEMKEVDEFLNNLED